MLSCYSIFNIIAITSSKAYIALEKLAAMRDFGRFTGEEWLDDCGLHEMGLDSNLAGACFFVGLTAETDTNNTLYN